MRSFTPSWPGGGAGGEGTPPNGDTPPQWTPLTRPKLRPPPPTKTETSPPMDSIDAPQTETSPQIETPPQ